MPKKRITLKVIADKLGISVPTVSRALKDYPDISKETKASVAKLVEELNYVPNRLALNLRKSKSNIIGVIIPEVVHLFFSSVIKGIMNIADSHGYTVLLTQSDEKLDQEKKHARLLFSAHVDGLLVCLSDETSSFAHFNMFKEFNIPIVLFDKVTDQHNGSQIVVNDREGAFNATQHLIHQGCRKILFLKGKKDPLNAVERYQGYCDALKNYNISLDTNLIYSCNEIRREEAYELVSQYINEKVEFDGIVAISDILALGALGACQDKGVKVPEDVCIIGFSDSEMCHITRPKLSSVYQPGYEIGQKAAEKLIEEIECIDKDETYENEKIMLETVLKVRGSSNRKPNQ